MARNLSREEAVDLAHTQLETWPAHRQDSITQALQGLNEFIEMERLLLRRDVPPALLETRQYLEARLQSIQADYDSVFEWFVAELQKKGIQDTDSDDDQPV